MINKNPLITCIIPTHNRFNLLKRAVESVLQQTYANKELLIINDHSDYSEYDLLNNISNLNTKIKLINLPNDKRGACAARNIGINEAKGEYISFLDDDDIWHPNKLAWQINTFLNDDVKIVYGSYITVSQINKKGRFIKQIKTVSYKDLLWFNYIGSTSLIMVKAELAKKIYFDEKLLSLQDADFYLRILKNGGIALPVTEAIATITNGNYNRISNNKINKIKGYECYLQKHKLLFNKKQLEYHLAELEILKFSFGLNRFRFVIRVIIEYTQNNGVNFHIFKFFLKSIFLKFNFTNY